MNNDIDLLVDSHVHFWQRARFDYPWLDDGSPGLQRDFLPIDLDAEMRPVASARATACVFVQADCREDHSLAEAIWVQELARGGAPVLAIVAHAPLELGDACASRLDELIAEVGLVTGIRRLLQDEPAGFATRPEFVDGVRLLGPRGLTMDLCVRQVQLREVAALVSQCPDVLFVLDHCGKPSISASGLDGLDGWADDLAELAGHANVRCKLSGLATEAPPTASDSVSLRPWLECALELFGPGRCMFGSDWPVLTTATTYDGWYELVQDVVAELTDTDRAAVMGGVAVTTYAPQSRAAQVKESGPWS